METVADLVKALLALPQDAPVRRQMTAEFGVVEIEAVRVEKNGTVVVD